MKIKRPFCIFSIGLIILIVIGLYFDISIGPFCYEKLYKEIINNQNLEDVNQSNVTIIGKVVENKKQTEYDQQYVIKIITLNQNGKIVEKCRNTKILLKIETKNTESLLTYGDLISFNCTLEIPSGQKNYMGYDYSQYLKTKGIYAIAQIDINQLKIVKHNYGDKAKLLINKINSKIEKNLSLLLSKNEMGVCLGILLGDTKYIDDDTKQNYRDANLTHILAVSGSHVSYIIIGVEKVLKNIGKRVSKIILIFIIIFIMNLTGNTPSVMRAGIMGIVSILADLFYKKFDSINNIAISCFIILLKNPYSILDLGFQLSYAGTLGILLFYDILDVGIKKFVNKTKEILKSYKNFNKYGTLNNSSDSKNFKTHNNNSNSFKNNSFKKLKISLISKVYKTIKTSTLVSISANIFIIPILAYHYNKISLIFFISNILIIPFFGTIIFLGFFVIIVSFFSSEFANIFSSILEIFIKLLNKSTEICSNIKLEYLVTTPKIIDLIFIYLIILLIRKILINKYKNTKQDYDCNFLKRVTKYVVIVYLCTFIFSAFLIKMDSNLRIYFIDVGQGDSTLIITSTNKKVLIDGGGSNTDFDVGKQILLPYLLDRGIKTLDIVMVSHFDSDHCGGILTIMEQINIKVVIISKQGQDSENYQNFLRIAKEKKIKIMFVTQGQKIRIDSNTYFDILWPKEKQLTENILNNNSIVAKLYYNNFSILLTGDIEEIAEKKILGQYDNSNILQSTVLKVAHHGSKSSTIKTFLDKVNPKIALIGVGENNTFGHPNEGVLQRLENLRC